MKRPSAAVVFRMDPTVTVAGLFPPHYHRPMPNHRPPLMHTALTRTRPALRLTLASAIAIALLAACGDKGVADPYQDAAGVFLLQSIGGQNLPAVIPSGSSDEVRVTTGSLFMSADRRFQETLTVARTPPGGAAQTGTAIATGSYTVVGDSVEFNIAERGSTPASKMQARLRGDSLSYQIAGMVVLYLKL